MSRVISCRECDAINQLGNQGPASVVEVVCWKCGTVMEVDQYRNTVVTVE
jgi:RNase P subunit RPR2